MVNLYKAGSRKLPEQQFQIHDKDNPYTLLSADDVMNVITKKCAPYEVTTFTKGKGKHTVVIMPEAAERMFAMIGYGKSKPRCYNYYEQIFHGIGIIFKDPEKDSFTVVITQFIYVNAIERSTTSAQVLGEEFNDNIYHRLKYERVVMRSNEKRCNTDEKGYMINPFVKYGLSDLVCFAHTHPNGLSVFFSSTDRKSALGDEKNPGVTMVVNPHKQDMVAMVGDSEDTRILLLTHKDKYNTYQCEAINNKSLNTESYVVGDITSNESSGTADESLVETDYTTDRSMIETTEAVISELAKTCSYSKNVLNAKGTYTEKTTLSGDTRITFTMIIPKDKK